MNILFVTATRIGDAVLSTGLLRYLLETQPEARVTVACGALPAPLFAGTPGVVRVIPLTKAPLATHWLGLWSGVVRVQWDLVVDLRGSALAWTLRAGERRVLRGSGAGEGHQVARLGRLFGLDPPPAPALWTTHEADDEAARLVPPGGPVLALGPTANWAPKSWPAQRFAELTARLTAPGGPMTGARVAVFAAPAERPAAAAVLAMVPEGRRLDLAGRIGLDTVAACLRRCALYIGNDSGLMHMAAAAGVPTLGLFGPSRLERYAPWGPHCAVVRTRKSYDELVGAAGFDWKDSRNLMETLEVDAVELAAQSLMSRLAA